MRGFFSQKVSHQFCRRRALAHAQASGPARSAVGGNQGGGGAGVLPIG